MLLDRIAILLGLNGTYDEDLLYEIVEVTESKILNYIDEVEMPTELEFVLIELSITRFNKIGSEGVETESVDGKQTTYEDDFDKYKHYLDDYIYRNSKNKGYKLL